MDVLANDHAAITDSLQNVAYEHIESMHTKMTFKSALDDFYHELSTVEPSTVKYGSFYVKGS